MKKHKLTGQNLAEAYAILEGCGHITKTAVGSFFVAKGCRRILT